MVGTSPDGDAATNAKPWSPQMSVTAKIFALFAAAAVFAAIALPILSTAAQMVG